MLLKTAETVLPDEAEPDAARQRIGPAEPGPFGSVEQVTPDSSGGVKPDLTRQ